MNRRWKEQKRWNRASNRGMWKESIYFSLSHIADLVDNTIRNKLAAGVMELKNAVPNCHSGQDQHKTITWLWTCRQV